MPLLSLLLSATLLAAATTVPSLTPLEQRWLQGLWPVVAHARERLGLPLDIVVQPQSAAGAAPLALGFVAGRCKLVLTLRDNPEAAASLARIPAPLQDGALELMAAHELGHCRRWLDGVWQAAPAGFAAPRVPEALSAELQAGYRAMRIARREEAYGDLVGLAWVQRQRPQQYAALHQWLRGERERELQPGSHHDTRAWLRLAADPARLAGGDSTIFAAAAPLWAAGLAHEDDDEEEN
ncbi:hypothetical protein G8A07_05395 [Roseateles sp. DAIF2]|uniref:hypothetical protein n=1 Tax=Roseateles sp. DAIF2 TaxID=2714952 RepID=UPI0018A2F40A|nr:hypothetical protein [Roseateles sp. DAIF2]QPF72423.1 hypothetical protein G8A07_05395 [Roseateles sp. DAIF2]